MTHRIMRLIGLCLLSVPVSIAARAQPQNEPPEELFRRAQAASREKDYPLAEKLYRRVLAVDPQILAARVNLGLAHYWQHKSREAVSELQKALQVSPREFSALLFSGLAYIDLGEYDRAQAALQQARQVKDTDPLLFWALGSLAMMHNDANTAVPLLERCATLDPNNVRCVWLLGQAYAFLAYRKEQKPTIPADYAARVDETLRWVEERQPNSALLHVFKGDVLAARKLTAEALAEYQKALEIDPRWPDIHLLLGSLLGLLGRWEEALAELKLQLRDYPDDTRAMVEMGSIRCRSGNYDEAVPVLKQALARDGNNYEANHRLGQCYLALGKCALAVPFLHRATQVKPEKTEPYYLLYRAYWMLKQPDKAAAALEEFKRLKSLGS
jgi:tetratricopeptide (TPR) repeat protein